LRCCALVAAIVLAGFALEGAAARSLRGRAACAHRNDVACDFSGAAVFPAGARLELQRDNERDNVSDLNAILRETHRRLLAGEASRTDVAEVEARLAAARSSLYAAQAQYAAARARYLAIIGVSPAEFTRKRIPARAKRR
jgi:hypothetical protein